MTSKFLDIILTLLVMLSVIIIQVWVKPLTFLIQAGSGAIFLICVLRAIYSAFKLTLSAHFDFPTRVALTFTAYLSVTIFLGIFLNFTPVGLTRESWLISYSIVACGALVFTAFARINYLNLPPTNLHLRFSQWLTLALAGILFILAFAIAQLGLRMQPNGGLTQFWMVKDATQTDLAIELGIYNAEEQPKVYSIVLRSRQSLISEWHGIEVPVNQTWKIQYLLHEGGIVDPITAQLFIEGQDKPYRHTELWLDEPTNSAETDEQID